MMEMHFFKKAEQVEISFSNDQEASVQDFFCFLSEISEWSQSCPLIYRSGQENREILYVMFRDFIFIGDDFWQIFGDDFCFINSRWKLDIFGNAYSSQETVWMSLEKQKGHYYRVQNTVSGKKADRIHALCLRIHCNSSELANMLDTLLQSIHWEKGIIAAEWNYHKFFEKEKIKNYYENSYFCYGSIFENMASKDYLQALTFDQKVELWTGYLKDRFDYKEFEWLYMMISERIVENRIEWELALHTAMKNLGYTMLVSEHEFELYNARSERQYFSFNSRQYAQMSLLKILFPVNT